MSTACTKTPGCILGQHTGACEWRVPRRVGEKTAKEERADVLADLRESARRREEFCDREDAARGEASQMTRALRDTARILRNTAARFERGDHEGAAGRATVTQQHPIPDPDTKREDR